LKKIEKIMWAFWPLDYKYTQIFKFKRNEKKLIDGWDVIIEKNWGKINWEDSFSLNRLLIYWRKKTIKKLKKKNENLRINISYIYLWKPYFTPKVKLKLDIFILLAKLACKQA
jgi:hypothetical protein